MSPHHAFSSLLVSLLVVASAPFAHAQQPPKPPDLDAHIERVRKEFGIPGLALAIVKDGKVVVARGYGVRELGRPAPVDERTLFMIASNTKAFTATALGLLVEEGKLEWDAPVVRYLPWFQLSDPYVTRELTVRDLLVHRSGLGLGAGDLLWWPPSSYDRKEISRRLRHLPLVTSFRNTYAYDNVLYIVAGELIEAVSGKTWEDFVATRLLARVGMTDSHPRYPKAGAATNVARGHARVEGTIRPVAPFISDNTNPAGGITSSARDMARWMLVQLRAGQLADGSPLFSPRTSRELLTVVTPMPIPDPQPGLEAIQPNFRGYGLGFELRDYRGHKLVTHAGVLPGHFSRVTMIPDLGLGVAVLLNQESGEALGAIIHHILSHYFGVPQIDWVAAQLQVKAREEAKIAETERNTTAARNTTSRPSLPLAAYAGSYVDPWYGEITIAQEGDRLAIRFGHTRSLVGDLEHWQYDTFVARWRDRELRADAFVTFALNPDGSIDRVKMRAVSPATDFSFDFHDLRLQPAPRKASAPVAAPGPAPARPSSVVQNEPGQ